MRYLLTTLATAFLILAVRADDIVLEAGKIADLKYDVVKGDKSTLRITPAPFDQINKDELGRFTFVGKAGVTYRIQGYVINFKKEKFVEVDDTVTFGDKATPAPVPPVPDDDKISPAGVAWIIVVEETQYRTQQTADILSDVALWKGLTDAGYKWRRYDPDAPDAVAKSYTAKATVIGLPAVLLLDKDGNDKGKFPLDRAKLEALKKK